MTARPDLVVLGGDYVTFGDRAFVGPVAELLGSLRAPHGVLAILGNHDDDRDMAAALTGQRFVVLRDQRTDVSIRGETLSFAGIRFWTRRTANIAAVLKGTPGTALLLAHDPRRLVQAAELRVPAVLSGHTHGGQVVFPGIGALARRRFPVLAGLAQQDDTSIFVSRGVGTVYVPVRLNCPPEVALVTLRRALA
jgi:predicted MPP superfamily phosphohydrolase